MIESKPEVEIAVPEGVVRARAEFLRQFSSLITDRKTRGKFICFHLEKLVAIDKDYVRLIRKVVELQIPESESMIYQVVPEAEAEERAIFEEAELP